MEKLLSVMIVDDERFVIEELCTMINWEVCGFQVIATVFNGRQGLKKFRELHPSLILADIRMPFMDGIEMIRQIREEDDTVNIVLLTVYEDFSYAKSAISLGITEYIIKSSITPDSLRELLENVRVSIYRQGKKDKIVTDWLLEQFFSTEKSENSADLDATLRQMHHIILISQDLPVSISGEILPEEIQVPKAKLAALLQNWDYPGWKLETITSLPGGQTVLAINSTENVYTDHGVELERISRAIVRKLWQDTGNSFTAFYLAHRISLYDLKLYCSENRNKLNESYFSGSGGVYRLEYPVMTIESDMDTGYSGVNTGEVFRITDRSLIKSYFHNIYLNIGREKNYDKLMKISRDFYFELRVVYQKLPELAAEENLTLGYNWHNWLDAEKIGEWFAGKFIRIRENTMIPEKQYTKSISDAVRFIYDNYRNPDLSVNDIAEYVHLSAGYLSGAFRKEVGSTIKNYITEVRINQAKRLLEQGGMKVHEVGKEVGYHSSQYFSQAFYKKVGILPGEYMKRE